MNAKMENSHHNAVIALAVLAFVATTLVFSAVFQVQAQDPCDGVTCGVNQHCDDGQCVWDSPLATPTQPAPSDPCDGVTCEDYQMCQQGVCIQDPEEAFQLQAVTACEPLPITILESEPTVVAPGADDDPYHESTRVVDELGYYNASFTALASRLWYGDPLLSPPGLYMTWSDPIRVDTSKWVNEGPVHGYVWTDLAFVDRCWSSYAFGFDMGCLNAPSTPIEFEFTPDGATYDTQIEIQSFAGALSWNQIIQYSTQIEGTVTAIILPDGCSPPSAPAPDPPPCNGSEMIYQPVTIQPNDVYQLGAYTNFDDYNVRFLFLVPPNEERTMMIGVNDEDTSFTVTGGAYQQYYEAVMPANPTSDPPNPTMFVWNTGDDPITLSSLCIQDMESSCDGIIDANMETTEWQVSTGAVHSFKTGEIIMFPDSSTWQVAPFDPGTFDLVIDAKSGGGINVLNVYAGGIEIGNITIPGDNLYRRYVVYFDVEESDSNYVIELAADAGNPSKITLTRACANWVYTAEGTETPTPLPTSTPSGDIYPGTDPQGCTNTDYGFNAPGAWTMQGAQIDDSVLSLLNYGSYAWTYSDHDTGTYNYWINICSANYIATEDCLSRQLDLAVLGANSKQRHAYITLEDDGQCHDYMGSISAVDYSGNPFEIERIQLLGICVEYGMQQRASIPDLESVWMQVPYLCLYGGPDQVTPTPSPTTPPGMTPTPTPTGEPAPTGCLNYDAGMDDTGYWAVSGGATIADSGVTMNAGSKLIAEIAQDSSRQYYVEIVGTCSYHSGATITWRNNAQTWSCTDPNEITYNFLFASASSMGTLAQPLSGLLEEQWNPAVLLSPLETPAYAQLGEHPFNARLSADLFQIEAFGSNSGQMEIRSICIKDAGWAPTPEPEDLELYHPVCERDYSIQKKFIDSIFGHFYGMLLGPKRSGMPVHTIAGGEVALSGEELSFLFGDAEYEYDGCVLVNHQDALNLNMQTIYCNLDTFSIPDSGIVERGALLGYTGTDHDGVLAFAMQLNGEWENPKSYFEGYPDCRPYSVYVEPQEQCDADDGSGIIPPRFNPATPGFWDVDEWVPWLAQRLYDVVGYPILCALIPIINNVISTLVAFANAVISAVSPPLIFLYRIGRVFEYMLYVFQRVLNELGLLFDAVGYVAVCIRAIITYFIAAIRAAVDADITITVPVEGTLFGFAFALAMTLISSTIANVILAPLVGLFIAYAAWKLVPWGIRNLGKGAGIVK